MTTKQGTLLGLGVVVLGSLALSRGGELSPEGIALEAARPEPGGVVHAVERGGEGSSAGVVLVAVPAELAAQLGLGAGHGALVVSVEPGSSAREAGLEQHDVVLALEGEPTDAQALAAALDGGRGAALRVARGGSERAVSIPAVRVRQEPFLSTDAFGPEHPFRRVAQLDELRQSTAERAEDLGHRLRELDDESRAAREAAKQAVAELQETAQAQAAEHLRAHQEVLLAQLDERLGEDRIGPVAELALDLERLLPAERLDVLDAGLAELRESLSAAPAERAPLQGEDETVGRARQRFASAGGEASRWIGERVVRPWHEARREADGHRERLGPQFAKRVEWTSSTVETIRSEIAKRIVCAVERAQERFAKELRARLKNLEAPAPGEIEAALADVVQQMDEMTHRLVGRTEEALDLYEETLLDAGGRLVPSLEDRWTACEEARAALARDLETELAGLASAPLVLDGSWQARSELERRIAGLRMGLRNAANAGRDRMRPGAVGAVHDLREHRVVTEDAWRDLQELLGGVRGEASNDCWKIDGPHLDGRFPRREAEEAPQGEVAIVTR